MILQKDIISEVVPTHVVMVEWMQFTKNAAVYSGAQGVLTCNRQFTK